MPENTIWWKHREIPSNKAENCSSTLEKAVSKLFFALYAVLKASFKK
jgi:hypothetical protein